MAKLVKDNTFYETLGSKEKKKEVYKLVKGRY